jgi:hypothetical protein
MKELFRFKIIVCRSFMTLVFLLGCERAYKQEQSPKTDKYSKFFSEIGVVKRPSKSILVPTQGCGPCIKAAMDFLRDSVSSLGIAVVISGPSEKSCSLAMKKFDLQRKDVIFDSEFRARDFGIMTIYPVILRYERDYWQSVDITPENHASVLTNH